METSNPSYTQLQDKKNLHQKIYQHCKALYKKTKQIKYQNFIPSAKDERDLSGSVTELSLMLGATNAISAT